MYIGFAKQALIEKIMENLKKNITELRGKRKIVFDILTSSEVSELVASKLGLLQEFTTIEMDRKYRIININDLDKLLVTDITTWRKYIIDFYDCDNYAHFFKDWMDFLYAWNGIGVAYGRIYISGMLVGLHSFNLIPVINDDGDIDLLIYEPQAHMYTEARQGAKIANYSYQVIGSEWY